MSLTIHLTEDQEAALSAKAQARGISAEAYVRQVLQHDLEPMSERSLGLFGSPEAALLDEVVSNAHHYRTLPQ